MYVRYKPVQSNVVVNFFFSLILGTSIFFSCTDTLKVPNSGLAQVEASCQLGGNFTIIGGWPSDPGCVYTCSNFANIPNMKAVSKVPVLANR